MFPCLTCTFPQDERFDEIKTIFSFFDKNATGKISADDLGTVLRAIGFNVTEKDVERLVNEYDENGDGQVAFAEIMSILRDNELPGPELREEDVLKHFAVFDRKKDGFIDEMDFIQILTAMGEPLTKEDIDGLYAEVFVDGDRRINYIDFVNHMFDTSRPSIGLSPWIDDEEKYLQR